MIQMELYQAIEYNAYLCVKKRRLETVKEFYENKIQKYIEQKRDDVISSFKEKIKEIDKQLDNVEQEFKRFAYDINIV